MRRHIRLPTGRMIISVQGRALAGEVSPAGAFAFGASF